MDDITREKVKNALYVFSAITLTALAFLFVLDYSRDDFIGHSALTTTFAVVGGGIKNVELGWLTNYITITVLGGVLLSTIVFLIASNISKKNRRKRIQALVKELIINAEHSAEAGNIENATQTYQQLQFLYPKLSEETKELLHEQLLSLHNKITAAYSRKAQPASNAPINNPNSL